MNDEILYGINIYGERVPLSEADLAQRAIDAAAAEAAANPPVDLVAYAKAARDAHENGGISVAGVPIATDDRSKTLVLGARLRAVSNPALVETWAAADGHVYPLTAPIIVAVSDAIGAFVSDLFAAYGKVLADIAAGTITTTAEIDARYGALEIAFGLPAAQPADEEPTQNSEPDADPAPEPANSNEPEPEAQAA